MTTPGAPPQHGGQRYLADRYRLEEVLGRGATGTVWAAYDEVLRRRVAVKEVPPPPGMPEPEAHALRERTLREARSIAVLSHPNVVTLYDVVRQDGEPFVVMELLPAVSLAKLINDSGPLDVAGAALVGNAVASALQAAHDAGITHRDVKPGNVLIGSGAANGRIKLTDFGIARNVAESTMTMTGMTLGSPAFIAPEVASGGQVTPAADLWGLGATLFAAVQGRPPYDGGDPLTTVAAVVNDEVPAPTAAGPLAPVITGLMTKDPAQRLSLAEVRRMVRPLLPPDGRVQRDAATTTVLPAAGPDAPTGWLPSVATNAHPTVSSQTANLLATAPRPVGGGPSPYGAPTEPARLAPDPGPLPFTPQRRPPRRRSAVTTVALALLTVVVFAAGAAGGFGLSRWAAGASLLPDLSTTRTTTPADPTGDAAGPKLVRQDVTVTNEPANAQGQALLSRFSIGVPEGWATYRPPLGTGDAPLVATFVSQEGNRTVTVEHLRGYYPKGSVNAYLKALQATLAKSVDEVVPQPVSPVGQPAAGAQESAYDTGFRTVERGEGPADELLRTTLIHLQPIGADLWVLKVTVPSDQQKAGEELFREVTATFTPS